MKKYFLYLSFLSMTLLSSCEDIVQIDIPDEHPFVVVEASITNLPGNQTILLRESQNYFDESLPKPISDAIVSLKDDLGNQYTFSEDPNQLGTYVWDSILPDSSLGKIGRKYTLTVNWNQEEFHAESSINRVPKIDSIAYKFIQADLGQGGDGKPEEGYEAQFFARDFPGQGDCYRIKAYKNEILFNESTNIVVTYDANFQKGPQGDGLVIILPLRRSISPELYLEGDKIKVELLSITENEFNFWSQALLEINNAGLFARPTANIPTNFQNLNPNSLWQGSGWFSTSAISSLATTIQASKANPNLVN